MEELLKINSVIYIYLVFVVLIAPTLFTVGVEFFITKKVTIRVSAIVVATGCLMTFVLAYQLFSTTINLSNNSLNLNSAIYSASVPLNKISKLEYFEEGLPTQYTLASRKNGIGLPNYFVGYFSTTGKKDAFVLASYPPFVVAKTKDDNIYIFSSSTKFMTELGGKIKQD